MNDSNIKLDDLLSGIDAAAYKLTKEDKEWLNIEPTGKEIIIDDLSVNQLEELTSYRLKKAITQADNVHLKLNKRIKNADE